jgi:CheY-like chemotaxis protein
VGSVTIRLGFDLPANKMLFSVHDTGIGMTAEQISNVFSPFQQADKSTNRFYGGTGLGLSISRQLARRLGGDIECRSEVGKGTAFTLSIHAGELGAAQWINEPPTNVDAGQLSYRRNAIPRLCGNVLLAEDNADIRSLILMYLQRAGLDAKAVVNGEKAVRESSHWNYDLVLMDMHMPVMNGLTAIRQLREIGINTPVVVLTANASHEDKNCCLSSGADDFLVKPVDVDMFYQLLSRYLAPRQIT